MKMFERTLQVIDENVFRKVQSSKILLVGVGGVGGFALEALVRSGFINITIIDHDVIDESNLNRQIITNCENIGKNKIEEAKKRCLDINPNLNIDAKTVFLGENNIDDIVDCEYDYIIDACDTITTKYLLIKTALEKNIKIISCMGTGNRLNPSKLSVTTLNKTNNDPLAKAMRSILKKNQVSSKIPVVWSSELPRKTNTRSPGSLIMVPATAGMLLVYYILDEIEKTTI